jgi:hypothetical protein
MAVANVSPVKKESRIADEVRKWNDEIKKEWSKIEYHLERKNRKGDGSYVDLQFK